MRWLLWKDCVKGVRQRVESERVESKVDGIEMIRDNGGGGILRIGEMR